MSSRDTGGLWTGSLRPGEVPSSSTFRYQLACGAGWMGFRPMRRGIRMYEELMHSVRG